MSKIREVFSPFNKIGKIFGFYPFDFDIDFKVNVKLFGVVHSVFIISCITLIFKFLVDESGIIKGQGSDLSRIAGIVSAFLTIIIICSIILNNFTNCTSFEKIFKKFLEVDNKVI